MLKEEEKNGRSNIHLQFGKLIREPGWETGEF